MVGAQSTCILIFIIGKNLDTFAQPTFNIKT